MSRRFFAAAPITESEVELTGSEAQHLAKVLRAQPGDEVTLFDGTGVEFAATVTAVQRGVVRLEILARCEVDRELPFSLTLAAALPKGDRQRWLVEKAVELGCTRLQPVLTTRGVAQPTGNALTRLQRAVIEAAKQCGRNRLMEIAAPRPLSELLRSQPTSATRLFAHTDGTAPTLAAACRSDSPTIVAIGPEGGFAPDEVDLADSEGWQRVSLGRTTLRTETAAIAAIAILAGGRSDPAPRAD